MYGGFVVPLLLLLNLINRGVSQSACSVYYRYMKDEITGDISGRIEIPHPPKNIPLHLRISLSVAAALPTKYVGRLELATSKVDAMKAVNQGKSLIYNLHFPIRNPVPTLVEIKFNGERYCTGSSATGPIVTTIFLEHILYPPGVIALSDSGPSSSNDDFWKIPQNPGGINLSPNPPRDKSPRPNLSPGIETPISEPERSPRPSSPTFQPQKPISRPDSPSQRNENNCGVANSTGLGYLIANGYRTLPGEWPWLAAIFLAKIEFEFRCAGSLITDRHVITAAHCKFQNDIDVPASAFIVSLGRYCLDNWRERGSQSYEVLNFRVHPDYNNRFSADADIAIIVLRKRVEFTARIQPICWSDPVPLEKLVGLNGYVVGWGKDEKGNPHLNEPRMTVTRIVSQAECISSHIAFISATSNRTFCAGPRDGSGPCSGDSGSGLVTLDPKTRRYHLRGVVSLSLMDVRRFCDLSQYVIYTDSAKFFDWIKNQTSD